MSQVQRLLGRVTEEKQVQGSCTHVVEKIQMDTVTETSIDLGKVAAVQRALYRKGPYSLMPSRIITDK